MLFPLMRKDQSMSVTAALLRLLFWKRKVSVSAPFCQERGRGSRLWELLHWGVAQSVEKSSKKSSSWDTQIQFSEGWVLICLLLAIHNLRRILNTKYLLILSGLRGSYSVNKHICMQTAGAGASRASKLMGGCCSLRVPGASCSAEMS